MKKIFFIGLGIVLIGVTLIFQRGASQSEPEPTPEKIKEPIGVSVQIAQSSKTINAHVRYPGLVQGDQEASIQAQAGGVITQLNVALGDTVSAGSILARIDDSARTQSLGDTGFRSVEVQQSELALQQAEEAIGVAEKNYKSLKKLYEDQRKDPNATKSITKQQVEAAKKQIEIAELQRDSARVGLQGRVSDRLIIAPFSGTISSRSVSIGDSVSPGRTIATISKTDKKKVQFFVEAEALSFLAVGRNVQVQQNDEQASMARITNIAPGADPITKRFRIEATPVDELAIPIGSVVSAIVEIQRTATGQSIILPISAITVGQNESYVFIVENGVAKKAVVVVGTIVGETAEISGTFTPQTQILIEGSKLVKEGEPVVIK